MTRLANIEKAGYFPIPPAVTELILSYITAPYGGRILDPAAGKGVALATLAQNLRLDPFGIELHEERAQEAKTAVETALQKRAAQELTKGRSALIPKPDAITRVLSNSYNEVAASKDGCNLLYLNPPYDWDNEDGRLEYQWLWRTRPWLQPGGLLVYVVPRHMLKMRKAARYLAAHYKDIRIYRFPDGEYERFKQVVVFAVRLNKAMTPDPKQVNALVELGRVEPNLLSHTRSLEPLTAAPEPVYALPPLVVQDNRFKFRSRYISLTDALAEAAQKGAAAADAWRRHLCPGGAQTFLQPLTPLKIGHMNGIIAAGHLNNHVLNDGEERLLIKGRSYKTTHSTEMEESLTDGRIRTTITDTEAFVTDITTLTPTGQITSYTGAELEQFLHKWIDRLTQFVAERYKPVYQFNLNGYGRLLNQLSKTRPIPGMNGQTGLLPAQKHATAAVLTRLEAYSEAIVVGEMGTGKTTIGAAVAAGRRARRTIVLCPPHLVDKWQREFKAVWPGVRTMHLQTIRDVDWFFADKEDDTPIVGILKQTTARSASGWEHVYDYGGPAGHKYSGGRYTEVRRPWGILLSAMPSPDETADASRQRPFTETQLKAFRMRGVRCPQCGATQTDNEVPLGPSRLKTATRSCQKCGSPLFQYVRRRSDSQQRGSFKLFARRVKQMREHIKQGRPIPFHELTKWHGSAVRDTFGYGKIPLAGYIKKRARKTKLDLLIIDEAHQYKGTDSDQGYAMHHLAQAAKKTVALTGTIYGGKASTLFHLLFRFVPEMRAAFINPEATGKARLQHKNWVSAYGILQRIETRTLNEDGTQTANSRSKVRYKELPGGSPAMLPWLLNRTVFLSLRDMGYPLPEYTEIPLPVAMSPAQAALYESLKEQLMEALKERLARGDKSLLAAYLYALLFWPDSPRRGKTVEDPRAGTIVAAIPGLPDDFIAPKEREIIRLCLEEKAQGRRAILFCQQTDTLDIQPEWKKMLAAAGLKAAILNAPPNKREKWVAQQVNAGVDIIITHPRKVETGIDLLDFPTLIWMAIDYSVYTVLQASRRSWRIGQTKPVKVYYFAYQDSIQEDALRLVAAKVAAATHINGDVIAADSLAELDELTQGDLITTLAKIVTGQEQAPAHDLQQAFAEANKAMQQSGAIIGDYQLIDEDADAPEPAFASLVSALAAGTQASLFNGQTPNGHTRNGQTANGHAINGYAPNGQTADGRQPNGQTANDTDAKAAPPVPRPRLLISQLAK